jgi:hypothetical protein
MNADFGLERHELSVIKRLSVPEKIQLFLDYEIGEGFDHCFARR